MSKIKIKGTITTKQLAILFVLSTLSIVGSSFLYILALSSLNIVTFP